MKLYSTRLLRVEIVARTSIMSVSIMW